MTDDNIRRVQFRQPRRVAPATRFQRIQGLAADFEALGGNATPDDLRQIMARINQLVLDIERGEV